MSPKSQPSEPAPQTGVLQHRVFSIAPRAEHRAVDEEKRTVELCFSSEEPYARWWGIEILDHGAGSLRLDRLNEAGPLLVEHTPSDIVGTIERAWVSEDRRGRAVVRFGRSPRAEEVFRDVVDGIRRMVSVGYIVHRYAQEPGSDPENPTFRAIDWEPLEVSLVAVPADTAVGVGKAYQPGGDPPPRKEQEHTMKEIEVTVDESAKKVEQALAEARRAEQNRVREIYAYVKHWPQAKLEEEAERAVREGTTIDEFREIVFKKLEAVGAVKPVETSGELGMSRKEVERFSLKRALLALAARGTPDETRLMREAAFEFECSREYAKKIGKTPRGFIIPEDVFRRDDLCRRDLTVSPDTAGGYTVATSLIAGSFIELLRNRLVVSSAGATILSGLVGDVAIPKQTAAATAYWVAENEAPTESQPAFGQLALSPKTIGAYTEISRKLLIQSSLDVEAFVRNELSRTIAEGIDSACLHGTGTSNQPSGIAVTSGVGSVVCGTNGGYPNFGKIVDLETAVAVANADVGRLAYVTNTKVRGQLKKTFTNTTYGERPIWEDTERDGVGRLNGYPAYVSNIVKSDLTKSSGSNLSAIFFGNWADLVIGFWSGVDILVDPYSRSTTGAVVVTAFMDVDFGLRHAASFSVILDARTA